MYELNYEVTEEESPNVALVNIGASMININILKGGVSVFTRDSSIGGNLITEALQREFTISYANAEKLKQEEAVEGVSYFRDTTNYENINEIILSGGVALTKDFAAALSERVGIEVNIADPFKNIEVPGTFDDEYMEKVAPIVSVAVGLAIRRVGDK